MTGHRAGHLSPHVLNQMTGSVAGHEVIESMPIGRSLLSSFAVASPGQLTDSKTEQSVTTQEKHAPAARKQPGDRRIPHVEPARIGTERWHHQPSCVDHEARSAHVAAAGRN